MDDWKEFINFVLLGDEYMTKTKYEKNLRDLEEKEGKMFTIREVASILNERIDTIGYYIKLHGIETFKIRYYRTQKLISLVPEREVLKLIADRTSALSILKAFMHMSNNSGIKTIEDAIDALENAKKE